MRGEVCSAAALPRRGIAKRRAKKRSSILGYCNSGRRGKPRPYGDAQGWLMASAWPPLPSRRRAPERVRRQPLAESGPVAAGQWQLSSAWALQRSAPFLPKAAGLRRARPQLLFPAWSVQVPSAVRLHTHFSCLGTCVLEQAIKRRLWLRPAICQVKQPLASAWVVIEARLSKHHDGDQDAQDEDNDRQQIDVVRQPRFLHGHSVCQEGRHEFIRRRRRGGAR